MGSHSWASLLLAVLLCSSAASAFNISRILDQYPEFSTFNSYLNQTHLVQAINRRETITVLVVDNSAMSEISGQPLDVITKVLSVHVVLDYYDTVKIRNFKRRTTLLTTMYQSSGLAEDQIGFLNITVTPTGVLLGSAEPGAGLTARLVKTVALQPYNISVLQISSIIVPPGIGDTTWNLRPPPPPPSPAPTPKAAPTPKKAPATAAPEPAASSPDAEPPTADSPPAPSAPAPAPEADAPAPAADSDKPADKGDAPAPSAPSSGTKVVFGAGLAAVVGLAMLATL